MSDWTPTYRALPGEELVVEVAVLDGVGRVYRAFGCRTDSGMGWMWALSHTGECADARDCDADDDYDVFAWRWPTPLPMLPPARRFKIMRDRCEDEQEVVGVVDGREAAQAMLAEIGEDARWAEIAPAPATSPEGKA